ncbi:hypothetical protein GH714_034662 [Hevea brasiliensis]|uniref:TOG domain-containing protein n=1 Tax=Hevea brasiliensis TaxID=3981 RepID=A0A6A6LY56_HEVBR|nr:hypothetical protein GH714_034662 [Hevea brasiliensis]
MSEEEKLLKEAKKLPWEDRLLHKNWKVRNEANIDLASLCDSITDPKDSRLRELGPFFKKTVADSNAPVQEKALDALIAYLRAADADAGRIVNVQDAMEKAIKNKVAKAVVPAIDVMFQALSEFGAKVVPPKRILKMLPELFDHQDQNVRASSKGLTLELCRWIGKDPVKSLLFEKMRDTMKKELEAELVNVVGAAKPSRKIRSEQDKEPEPEAVSEVVGIGHSEEAVADAPQEIDEYELVDPVDILTPLEKDFLGWSAAKWSERKEAVAELTKLASTKRIAPGDFSEVCRTLKKSVGMRPLERSLEKLDDVRRKKLSEMISVSGGNVSGGASSATVQAACGSMSSGETSESSFVRKSAASMLTGKKPVPAAPSNKKGGPLKSGANKKGDGAGRPEISKAIEAPEDVEPAEMSLEEIESRLGSLIRAETVSQLKSTVWKERLEAITSLKQQVEGLQDLDRSVEILIRLLCAIPGWSEKNVQVQQQMIEVITYLASTASKFPKKCVVLCLLGISERVADIKTRAHAMKCLTTFSEAVGPAFIFERLYKIMKEHKNPKVLSEGILWMVSAVEDFGISHLKLKDLIDFCKDIGLQSSVAASRNATIKLLGALHKFVGPDIKGFLADVKPALLSALDAEYEKNPFEGASAVPKKTVKSSESVTSVSGGGLDSLPREDISGKVTPVLLKSMESPDWKVRLESIEAVNKILEEANKRIQPTGTGELFGALRGRLYDSNKNLVMATLTTIGGVASAMGPAVEKSSKGILSDILKCLGDNKKHMRECALTTIDSWAAAVHLDKMIPYLAAALMDTKLGAEGPGSAMVDKSSDVRKAAEACIAEVLRVSGQEIIEKNLKDLHGPALTLVLERLKPYGAFQEDREKMVVRRFKFEELRIEQIQDLENDMMKIFREDLHRRLLSADFKKQVEGLEMLQKALPSIVKETIEVLDILLRWFVLQFCKSNTTCLLKVLEFLPELFVMLRDEGYTLTESEAAIFLPCLIEKVVFGHNIEKVREKMRELTKNCSCIFCGKTFPHILEGLRSKNNRTRIECADLVGFLIDHHGAEISGQLKYLQVVASLTAERDGPGDGKEKEGRPGDARAALRRSIRENGSDLAEQSGEVSQSISGPAFSRKNYSPHELNMERQIMPRAVSSVNGPTDWNEALDIISFGSPDQSVEGMKVVCHELAQATSDPEGNAMDELVKDADRLVSCLASKAITLA